MKNIKAVIATVLAIVVVAPIAFAAGCAFEQQSNPAPVVQKLEQNADEAAGSFYAVDATVEHVETCEGADAVVCQDERGQLLAFGGTGYNAGDRLTLIMHDADTDTVLDDEVRGVAEKPAA